MDSIKLKEMNTENNVVVSKNELDNVAICLPSLNAFDTNGRRC